MKFSEEGAMRRGEGEGEENPREDVCLLEGSTD